MNSQHDTDDGRLVEEVWDAVISGATLKDIQGVPQAAMDGLYAYAYDYYDRGRLDEAEVFFRFLCIYDFYNPDYLMGLAAVNQLKKRFRKAIDLYAVAYALGKDDFRPIFFSGQCHLSLRSVTPARECFVLVCERSPDESLRVRARAYLDVLDANVDESVLEQGREMA